MMPSGHLALCQNPEGKLRFQAQENAVISQVVNLDLLSHRQMVQITVLYIKKSNQTYFKE